MAAFSGNGSSELRRSSALVGQSRFQLPRACIEAFSLRPFFREIPLQPDYLERLGVILFCKLFGPGGGITEKRACQTREVARSSAGPSWPGVKPRFVIVDAKHIRR